MVFWGIVVKPGTPFTLSDNRRLHLSQATLGVGSATTKSIVQCNVGDKTPLFLCTLIAEKMECCPLNLKYEEADEVVFSVIGSRPVHLTGYYEENSTNVLNGDVDDKTESYGEDISENETERSESDDGDEYGGSFINDGDVEVLPTSPAPEVGKRSHRKKRYTVESDNDDLVNDTSKLALPSAEVDETSGKTEEVGKRSRRKKRYTVESDNDDLVSDTSKLARPSAEVDETSGKTEEVGKRSRRKKRYTVESDNDDLVNGTSKLALPSAEVDETSGKTEEVGKRSRRKKRYTVESDNDDPVNDTSKLALPSAEVDEKSGKKEVGKLMNGHIVESDNDIRSLVTAPKHALPNAEVDGTSCKKDDTKLMKCHKGEPNKGNCSPVNATPQLFGIFDVSDSEEDDTRPIGSHQRHNRAFESLSYGSVGIQRVAANSKNSLIEDKSGTLTLLPVNDLAALKPERDSGMESDFGIEHEEEPVKELISSKSVNNLPQLDPLLVRLKNTVDNGDSLMPKLEIKTDDADAGKSLKWAKEILENSNNDGAQVKQRKKKKPKAAEDCCKDDINGVDKAVKNGKLDSDDGQEKQRKKRKRKAAEDCCKDDINEVDKALKNGKPDSDVDAGRESDFGSKHEEEQQRELISSKSVDNLPQLDPLLVQLKNTVDNRDSPAPKLEMKTDDADADKSLEGAKESLENSNDDGQVKERKKKKRKTAEDCCKDDINEVDKALKNGKLDSDEVFLVNEDKSCLKSQLKERKRKKKNDSNIKDVDKSKTSANELVIEEQEIGNPDGKIATMGKRGRKDVMVGSLV